MNPNKIIERIIAECPYPSIVEPNGHDWKRFGVKVCDILIEAGLVDPEVKGGVPETGDE